MFYTLGAHPAWCAAALAVLDLICDVLPRAIDAAVAG